MTWAYVKYPVDDESSAWLLVKDGVTIDGPYLCGLQMISDITDGLNLLQASRDQGFIEACKNQTFEFDFYTTPSRRKNAPSKRSTK